MQLLPEERETVIITNDSMNTYEIWTSQPKLIKKLRKLGYKEIDVEMCEGDIVSCKFELNLSKITFKNAITKKREYTDEERKLASERMKRIRQDRSNNNE